MFQWPGMGLLFVQAVQNVDIPIMAAYLMLVALIFVVINLTVDLLYTSSIRACARPSGGRLMTGTCAAAIRSGPRFPADDLALAAPRQRRLASFRGPADDAAAACLTAAVRVGGALLAPLSRRRIPSIPRSST